MHAIQINISWTEKIPYLWEFDNCIRNYIWICVLQNGDEMKPHLLVLIPRIKQISSIYLNFAQNESTKIVWFLKFLNWLQMTLSPHQVNSKCRVWAKKRFLCQESVLKWLSVDWGVLVIVKTRPYFSIPWIIHQFRRCRESECSANYEKKKEKLEEMFRPGNENFEYRFPCNVVAFELLRSSKRKNENYFKIFINTKTLIYQCPISMISMIIIIIELGSKIALWE